jgi:hypothetical protein
MNKVPTKARWCGDFGSVTVAPTSQIDDDCRQ